MTATRNKHAAKSGVLPVIDLPALAEHFEVTPTTLLVWVESGLFPRPMRIGRRTLRWSVTALNEWIAAGCPPMNRS